MYFFFDYSFIYFFFYSHFFLIVLLSLLLLLLDVRVLLFPLFFALLFVFFIKCIRSPISRGGISSVNQRSTRRILKTALLRMRSLLWYIFIFVKNWDFCICKCNVIILRTKSGISLLQTVKKKTASNSIETSPPPVCSPPLPESFGDVSIGYLINNKIRWGNFNYCTFLKALALDKKKKYLFFFFWNYVPVIVN